jgi:hypothetical protein
MAEPSTLKSRLRTFLWSIVRSDGNASSYEHDVAAVVGALSTGDEVLARTLADAVTKHYQRHAKADDLGVRGYWYETLGEWDGSDPPPPELAARFTSAMAMFLRAFGDAPSWEYVATPERTAAVQKAWQNVRTGEGIDGSRYEQHPGYALLSAGLVAMGIPGEKRDDMLSTFHKR